jgi:hypothetical protein
LFEVVQFWQAPPPAGPHASFWLPTTQVFPMQQPDLQFEGPHVGAWQTPDSQTSDGAWFAQFAHEPPPVPHAVSCVPMAQTSPTQQPEQFDALHKPFACVHVPVAASHTEFAGHDVHVLPATPHDCGVTATTHWSPTQQPAQVDGPHGDGT